MALLQLGNTCFWRSKEPLMKKAARQTRNADPAEAQSYVWERLDRRYGNLAEVDEEELDRYIFNSARRYWHRQHGRKITDCRTLEKYSLDRGQVSLIGTRILPRLTIHDNNYISELVDIEECGKMMRLLDPDIRDLVQERFGIDTDALSVRQIAVRRKVSPQSVNRRLSRSFAFLKHSFPNFI